MRSGSRSAVSALAFHPSGKMLASSAGDNVQLWDLSRRGPKERDLLKGHTTILAAVAFTPDGQTLASGDYNGRVRLWDLSEKEVKQETVWKGHSGAVLALAFAPHGKSFVSAGRDGRVVVWGAGDGKRLCEWQFGGQVHDVAIASDGHHLATANANGTIYILRLQK